MSRAQAVRTDAGGSLLITGDETKQLYTANTATLSDLQQIASLLGSLRAVPFNVMLSCNQL